MYHRIGMIKNEKLVSKHLKNTSGTAFHNILIFAKLKNQEETEIQRMKFLENSN
jgi:hypothetical protein